MTVWNKISQEAKDFLMRLLCYDPEKRVTAYDALNDPWITKFCGGKCNCEEDLAISLERLRCFKTQMTLQKAVLTYIASQQLSKSEERKLREVFELLDEDKNGSISKNELIKGYTYTYKDTNRAKAEVEKVMMHVDINQSGSIDYNGKYVG